MFPTHRVIFATLVVRLILVKSISEVFNVHCMLYRYYLQVILLIHVMHVIQVIRTVLLMKLIQVVKLLQVIS